MDIVTSALLTVASAIVAAYVLYFVVRKAVTAALKETAVWKAEGGVQAVFDEREFARTGIRPKRPTEG